MKKLTQHYYTLIELMVSLSVLLVLLSLLQPAINKVIHNAHTTKCINNLKQNGLALQLYTEDQQQFLPGPLWQWTRAAGKFSVNNRIHKQQLAYHLRSYISMKHKTIQSAKVDYLDSLMCPGNFIESFPKDDVFRAQYILHPNTQITNLIISRDHDIRFPFGLLHNHDQNPRTPARVIRKPLSLSMIPQPSELIGLRDFDNFNYKFKSSELPDFPVHIGFSRNYLYMDFSVRNEVQTVDLLIHKN